MATVKHTTTIHLSHAEIEDIIGKWVLKEYAKAGQNKAFISFGGVDDYGNGEISATITMEQQS